MSITIQVNGQPKELPGLASQTLDGVIAALALKADRIAVEHNGEIARRSAWQTTPVQDGDRLEIVHFVGGGVH